MNKNSLMVELRSVRKHYHMGDSEVKALDGVSLKIKKQEFVAIVGPSGSGKSTLLHMVGVLDTVTDGKIILDGVDTSKLPESEIARLRGVKVGFVFQFFNLYPTLTALENVELPMIIIEKDRSYRKNRAMELLREVGVDDRANHLPSQLSGGQRQRVAIARALANDPPLIIADEPTGNLDSKTGAKIMRFLSHLQKSEGKTIVMVTHEGYISKYAKRVIHLKDGKIIRGN